MYIVVQRNKITMPTTLNVSLPNDEREALEKLRLILEKQSGARLSLAEVVRIAIRDKAKAIAA